MPSKLCPHRKQQRDCPKCKAAHRNRQYKYYLSKTENRRTTWRCGNCGYRQNLRDEQRCHWCFAPRQA